MLQHIFASINVRLGLLEDHYLADEDEWRPLKDEELGEAEPAIRRSCELLQYIVREPHRGLAPAAAAAVRNVCVRAYSYEGKSPPAELLGTFNGLCC